ncbi:MAG: ABC transporter ATP-binding protein [Treponemataceae bacterium]|nr:MAG: ABC transporter ATP-binding protein [Treponemataceae bacterium]
MERGKAENVRHKNVRLNVKNVSIVFGGLGAVTGFSATVYDGELVGLIGPNGAGKTTLFNMLSGLYKPTEGEILFCDRSGREVNVCKKSAHSLSKIGISRTFQNIRLFGNMSVLDNVRVALHPSRAYSPSDALFRTGTFTREERIMTEKAERLLELFKLYGKREENAKNLPYGEQRKLEIARALALSPKLLLLDEPAAGMNPQETHELMEMIDFIHKKFDLTIILIEHDMHLVMGVCERLIVLEYGKVIAEGAPAEIRANPQVVKAYLGSEALS